MTSEAYIHAIEGDVELLHRAAGGPLTATIASCPGWDLADLLYHLGGVHRSWAQIVAEQLSDPGGIKTPARPDDADLPAWSRDSAQLLLAAIRTADPATEVWTWTGPQKVEWVQRRQAQETAVHRWDAQRAIGEPDPIEGWLAADGIDEYFSLLLGTADGSLGGSVHLHATDAPLGESPGRGSTGEWWIAQVDDRWVVEAEHRKGDVALRGSASDLLLALWRRIGPDDLDCVGDLEIAGRFLYAARRS